MRSLNLVTIFAFLGTLIAKSGRERPLSRTSTSLDDSTPSGSSDEDTGSVPSLSKNSRVDTRRRDQSKRLTSIQSRGSGSGHSWMSGSSLSKTSQSGTLRQDKSSRSSGSRRSGSSNSPRSQSKSSSGYSTTKGHVALSNISRSSSNSKRRETGSFRNSITQLIASPEVGNLVKAAAVSATQALQGTGGDVAVGSACAAIATCQGGCQAGAGSYKSSCPYANQGTQSTNGATNQGSTASTSGSSSIRSASASSAGSSSMSQMTGRSAGLSS